MTLTNAERSARYRARHPDRVRKIVRDGMRRKRKECPEYSSWLLMNDRCSNPRNKDYKNYGGRGIEVCAWWRSFANFLTDMGPRPGPGYSIDRYPNTNGNYESNNCRWATTKQQNRNTRRNHLITFNGKSQCLSAWAEETSLPWDRILWRLNNGWSIERALQ